MKPGDLCVLQPTARRKRRIMLLGSLLHTEGARQTALFVPLDGGEAEGPVFLDEVEVVLSREDGPKLLDYVARATARPAYKTPAVQHRVVMFIAALEHLGFDEEIRGALVAARCRSL